MEEREKISYGAFWEWFATNSDRLRSVTSAGADEYQELGTKVSELVPGISVEIGRADSPRDDVELIFTAHGASDLFDLVDEFVASAPLLNGWRWRALKPPLLEDFELNYEGRDLKTQDIWIRVSNPRSSNLGTVDLQVALRIPNNDDSITVLQEAALLAIESYLGERVFGTIIGLCEFEGLLNDPPALGYIRLSEVAGYLGVHRFQ